MRLVAASRTATLGIEDYSDQALVADPSNKDEYVLGDDETWELAERVTAGKRMDEAGTAVSGRRLATRRFYGPKSRHSDVDGCDRPTMADLRDDSAGLPDCRSQLRPEVHRRRRRRSIEPVVIHRAIFGTMRAVHGAV